MMTETKIYTLSTDQCLISRPYMHFGFQCETCRLLCTGCHRVSRSAAALHGSYGWHTSCSAFCMPPCVALISPATLAAEALQALAPQCAVNSDRWLAGRQACSSSMEHCTLAAGWPSLGAQLAYRGIQMHWHAPIQAVNDANRHCTQGQHVQVHVLAADSSASRATIL